MLEWTDTGSSTLDDLDTEQFDVIIDYNYYLNENLSFLEPRNSTLGELGKNHNVLLIGEVGDGLGAGGYWPRIRSAILTAAVGVTITGGHGFLDSFADEMGRNTAVEFILTVKRKLKTNGSILISLPSKKSDLSFYFPKSLDEASLREAINQAQEIVKEWDEDHTDYRKYDFYYSNGRWILLEE